MILRGVDAFGIPVRFSKGASARRRRRGPPVKAPNGKNSAKLICNTQMIRPFLLLNVYQFGRVVK